MAVMEIRSPALGREAGCLRREYFYKEEDQESEKNAGPVDLGPQWVINADQMFRARNIWRERLTYMLRGFPGGSVRCRGNGAVSGQGC
ncbi:hypothetical protein [Leisingera thetidis]|uniref:hypothetical protein n=1 Tax=Leisingera thetidis TaxID=2930199 RepID=UPI0021F6A7B7|nr:hypothetical protein [Leisingera thetidis]